jgi:hypothetical protein
VIYNRSISSGILHSDCTAAPNNKYSLDRVSIGKRKEKKDAQQMRSNNMMPLMMVRKGPINGPTIVICKLQKAQLGHFI